MVSVAILYYRIKITHIHEKENGQIVNIIQKNKS